MKIYEGRSNPYFWEVHLCFTTALKFGYAFHYYDVPIHSLWFGCVNVSWSGLPENLEWKSFLLDIV